MEKYLDKKQSTALSKSDVAAYVHDMKELEIKHYTLKKFHKKLTEIDESDPPLPSDLDEFNVALDCRLDFKFADDLYKSAEINCKSAETDYEKAKQSLNTAKQSLDKALQNRKTKSNQVIERPKEVKKPSGIGATIGYGLLCGFSLAVSLIQIIDQFVFLTHSAAVFIPILSLGLCIILGLIFRNLKNQRYLTYLQKQQEYDQYINQENNIKYCQNQYELAQKNLSETKKVYEINRAERETAKTKQEAAKAKWKSSEDAYDKALRTRLDMEKKIAEFIAPKIAEMERKKNQLYSLNIVPPDYRTLDCIIEFDQMYRNDLVDTMRQAVMIYEERVFRGELIRGIDKIYNMLGQLNATMGNIENVLYSVQNEVSKMSNDLEKMLDSIDRIESSNSQFVAANKKMAEANKKFQDDMIAESRAARYATEALRDTTDRCEWYMNRQYWNH